MSKYFDTKPGSLEEAYPQTQQAAILSPKRRKVRNQRTKVTHSCSKAKEKGEKTFMLW